MYTVIGFEPVRPGGSLVGGGYWSVGVSGQDIITVTFLTLMPDDHSVASELSSRER